MTHSARTSLIGHRHGHRADLRPADRVHSECLFSCCLTPRAIQVSAGDSRKSVNLGVTQDVLSHFWRRPRICHHNNPVRVGTIIGQTRYLKPWMTCATKRPRRRPLQPSAAVSLLATERPVYTRGCPVSLLLQQLESRLLLLLQLCSLLCAERCSDDPR